MKIELSVLDRIQVASPCAASWDAMAGDDAVRFCGDCSKQVYRFEGMGRAEIVALLERTEGEVCVRLSRRRDGTLITNDCPVGKENARRRRRFALLLACLPLTLFGSVAAYALRPRPTELAVPPAASFAELEEVWSETLEFFGLRKPTPTPVIMGGCPAPPRPMMGKMAGPAPQAPSK